MHFFHLNYVNAQGILAQRIYDERVIFVNFLMLKWGTIPTAKHPWSVDFQ